MTFDTNLGGTGVDLAGSVVLSPSGPSVPWLAMEDPTGPEPGPETGANAEGRLEAGAGVWIECHERDGVVEIRNPGLFRPGREAFCRALAHSAIEGFQARRVEICLTTSMCRLEFPPGEFDRAGLARRVAEAVKAATPSIRDRAGASRGRRLTWTTLTAFAADGGVSIRRKREDRPGRAVFCDTPAPTKPPPGSPRGTPRPVHLALAGGSLTMAVAGAILPGIPSLPFLLMTARHAAHLSPGIDRFLRCRPWSAAILAWAEASGGPLRLDRRALLKMLPPFAIAAAAFAIVRPPMPVVMGLEIGVMAFVGFRELARPGDRELALGERA